MAAPQTSPTVLVLSGRLEKADIAKICERARVLLEGCSDRVLCDVSRIDHPDAVLVDALANLQLTAQRVGRKVMLLHADDELRDLVRFMGLKETLPSCVELPLEVGGDPEQREEPGGLEEEADTGDGAAGDLEDL